MEISLHLETYIEKHRYKYLALYHALRDAIMEGRLPGGTKLPSTRELADQYGLSRGSAALGYDMLVSEGYVHSEVGRGTFVAQAGPAPTAGGDLAAAPLALSRWGERLLELPPIPGSGGAKAPAGIDLGGGGMSMELFPYAEWRSAMTYAGGRGGEDMQRGADPAGDLGLRQALAAHLRVTRGIHTDPEQIVLFSGSMQGITLLFQLLLNEGEAAVLEDPCYSGIIRAAAACGAEVIPAEVDVHGIRLSDWDARLVLVTPSRQYPTGAVLTLERRRQLLDWAERHQAVILEDDYDSEFRFGGRPIEPLKTLDTRDRVIYIGSFSKTMFAGLRLGYAIVPQSLVDAVLRAKTLYEPLTTGLLEQRALARFMARGDYGRHLRRLTRIYGARHRHFCARMREKAGHLFSLMQGDSGLHVYAYWLQPPEAFAAFTAAAAARGVTFRDASGYRIQPGPPAAFFSYARWDERQLEEGVDRLAAAWEDIRHRMNG